MVKVVFEKLCMAFPPMLLMSHVGVILQIISDSCFVGMEILFQCYGAAELSSRYLKLMGTHVQVSRLSILLLGAQPDKFHCPLQKN